MSAAVHTARTHQSPKRAFSWLGFLLFGVVTLRAYTYRGAPNASQLQSPDPVLHTLFLVPILLLLLTDPFLFRRYRVYRWIYFPLQILLIQGLGLVRPYQDLWGLLYVAVGVQAFAYLPSRWALRLCAALGLAFLTTLSLTLGWPVGFALGLTTLAGCALMVTYEVVYRQVEANRLESEQLLAELQEATTRLKSYTAQSEAFAAAHERDRLAGDLHDSVSQTLFSISLLAQSVRVLLEKDPAQVPAQLEALQAQTSDALATMRNLIQAWRPPPSD